MWFVKGNLDCDDADAQTCLYLRPSRIYACGRAFSASASAGWHDFPFAHDATVSRHALDIKCGDVDLELQANCEHTATPCYAIELQCENTKDLAVTRANGTAFSLSKGSTHDIQSGDTLTVGNKLGRKLQFEWRPLLIAISAFSTEPSEINGDPKNFLLQTGARFTTDEYHPLLTHWVFAGEMMANIGLVSAALSAVHIVSSTWIDEMCTKIFVEDNHVSLGLSADTDLVKYRKENGTKVGSDTRYWSFSSLEKNADVDWPKESEHPATWQTSLISDFGNMQRWLPSERRKTLFQNTLFVTFDTAQEWVEAYQKVLPKGSAHYHNVEGSHSSIKLVQKSVAQAMSATKIPRDKLLTFFLDVDAASDSVLSQVAESLQITSCIKMPEILYMVYYTQIDVAKYNRANDGVPTPQIQDRAPVRSVQKEKLLVPPSSTLPPSSGQSLWEQIPSTNPLESTINPHAPTQAIGETQPEPTPQTAPASSEADAAPARKKKLVRRAGQAAASFEPIFEMANEFQASMSANLNANADEDIAMQVDQPHQVKAAQKTSRLKRRAGQPTQEFDYFGTSQFTQEPPAKKQRHAEPDTQAQEAAAAENARKRKVETEEVAEARKRVRKAEQTEQQRKELQQLRAEEVAREATMTEEERRRAKRKVVKTSAAVDDDEEMRKKAKAKYLQVDYGKRKVNETDKQFAKEFNALKIAKPLLLKRPAQPRLEKDDWRGMDRTREEDEDIGDWSADTGKSFFVIRTLQIEPREEAENPSDRVNQQAMDPQWATMPNYKKFRPKNVALIAPVAKRVVELVPSYEFTATQESQHADDLESDNSDEALLPSFARARKISFTNEKAKASKPASAKPRSDQQAAAPRGTQSAVIRKGKAKGEGEGPVKPQYVELSDSDEEDELADSHQQEHSEASFRSSSTIGKRVGKRTASQVKGTTLGKTRSAAETKQPKELSEEEDESDDLAFKGFGKRSTAVLSVKRMR